MCARKIKMGIIAINAAKTKKEDKRGNVMSQMDSIIEEEVYTSSREGRV